MKRILNDIQSGEFKPVYLLYGEERYLRRQYKDKLKNALCAPDDNMNVHYYGGKGVPVGEIIDLAETLPFLAQYRVIFIDNSGLFKSGGEALAEYFEAQNESTIFIFTESEVDKRSKLFKAASSAGCAVDFAIQDENTLKKWVAGIIAKEGKKITESNVQLFLSKTGTDMENIQMELEKLLCYCMDEEVIETMAIEEIVTTRVTNHIFDMVDAVANRDTSKALGLYYDLITLKEPPMRILFLIARHCNILLQLKEMKAKGHSQADMAKAAGVPPFAVNKYLSQASKFKSTTLRNAVAKCVDAEEAVKTGRMNDGMSVELLLVGVFQNIE